MNMIKHYDKRQRTGTDASFYSSEESIILNALNYFQSNYKGFLQECMIKAGLKKSMTLENSEVFYVAMLQTLQIDIKKAKEFEIPSEYKSIISELEYWNTVEGDKNLIDSEVTSKITRVLDSHPARSYTFRKLCMLIVGCDASKFVENGQSYIIFMLRSLNVVKKYLDELEPKSRKRDRKSKLEIDNTKAEDIIRNFLTSVSEKKFSSVILINRSIDYTIYRAKKDGSEFALKVSNETSEHSNKHSLENEFQNTQKSNHPCLRKSFEMTTYDNMPALSLEWFDGKPIEECGKFEMKDFIFVSREIISAIVALHGQNINHLNISTSNVLVNLQTRTVKIIGFTSSTKYEIINFDIGNQKRLAKGSKFIPPEQSGCTNLHVDLRSDFYDIGMVFYFMLIGRFSFSYENKSQLVHNSLFGYITPLTLIDPSIPVDLSNIILKLLEKDPANRYQSAKGVLYDIDLINDENRDDLSHNTFALAEHDFASKLFIPQKLYGRSSETNTLYSLFEKACEGSLEVAFIKGLSGTGKSHLVHDLLESVTRKKGFFIHGKFQESTMIEPYSGIISALNRFCDLVLLEGSSTVSFYKDRILAAVGEEGKILLNMVPKLRCIIGEQGEVVEAIGAKAKNRLDYICCNFLGAVSTKQRPLVFLLDNLNRADEDSFLFLSAMLRHKYLRHILFIGTYHSDKAHMNDHLSKVIKLISKNKVSVTTIELGNLKNEEVNNLVADTVSRSQIATVPLTALVVGKTAGNLFFVKEFLKSLESKGLLFFCKQSLCWKWNIEEFFTSEMSNNVLIFIIEKIRKYESSMQKFLIHASFIGSSFSLKTLKLINDAHVDIDRMVKDGFIFPNELRNSFRFTHDYVRQAAHSLVPNENRDFTYFSIGNLIWKKSSKVEMQENVLIVAKMLNSSLQQLNQEERRDVAELNFQAAERCIALTAFQPALNFLETTIRLLDISSWIVDYEFTLKLYRAAAETSYCLMNYEQMSQFLTILAKNAKCDLDLLPSYILQIRAFNHRCQYKDAFSLGLQVLSDMDEKIPLELDEGYSRELEKSIFQASQKVDDVINLEIVVDETTIAVFKILYELFVTAFFHNSKLLPLISSRIFQLTCNHGLSKYSSFGISMVGKILCDRGDFVRGVHYGKMSIAVIDKFRAKDLYQKVIAYVYMDICFFETSVHQLVDPLFDAIFKGLEVGDNEGCCYTFSVFYFYSFHCGKNLQSLMDDFDSSVDKVPVKLNATLSIYQSVLNFIGFMKDGNNAGFLTGDYFDYQKNLDFHNQPGHAVRGLFQCIVTAYFFHEYDSALEWLEMRNGVGDCIAIKGHPFLTFYEGLIYLENNSSDYKLRVQRCIDSLRRWSKSCAENFLNKLLLLEAEFASKMANYKSEAIIEKYNKAISSSKENGFIHEKALACERAAIFCISLGHVKSSDYFSQAFEGYKQWGAYAKCMHLKEKFPTYLVDMELPSDDSTFDICANENQSNAVSELSMGSNALKN